MRILSSRNLTRLTPPHIFDSLMRFPLDKERNLLLAEERSEALSDV